MDTVDEENPTNELLRNGLSYWQSICRGRPMPLRADFDPLDIPKLLPYVMLVDVLREPLDFRFRLLGSRHDRIVKSNYCGIRFSELPHTAEGNPIWDQHERIVVERRPLCGHVNYVGPDPLVPRTLEHCLMPLSHTGEHVDIIFTVTAIDGVVANRSRLDGPFPRHFGVAPARGRSATEIRPR